MPLNFGIESSKTFALRFPELGRFLLETYLEVQSDQQKIKYYQLKRKRLLYLHSLDIDTRKKIHHQYQIIIQDHEAKIANIWSELDTNLLHSKVGDEMAILEYHVNKPNSTPRHFHLHSQIYFLSATWESDHKVFIYLLFEDHILQFHGVLDERLCEWRYFLTNAKELQLLTVNRYLLRFKHLELRQQLRVYSSLLPSMLPTVLMQLILEYNYNL